MLFDNQFTVLGDPPPCEAQCITGALLYVAGTVWGAFDAASTARRTNERKLREIDLAVTPNFSEEGMGIAAGVQIPVSW